MALGLPLGFRRCAFGALVAKEQRGARRVTRVEFGFEASGALLFGVDLLHRDGHSQQMADELFVCFRVLGKIALHERRATLRELEPYRDTSLEFFRGQTAHRLGLEQSLVRGAKGGPEARLLIDELSA